MNDPPEKLHARIAELERAVEEAIKAKDTELLHRVIHPEPPFWSAFVRRDGVMYFSTGKWGTNIKTGQMAKEFTCKGKRIWVLRDGTITED